METSKGGRDPGADLRRRNYFFLPRQPKLIPPLPGSFHRAVLVPLVSFFPILIVFRPCRAIAHGKGVAQELHRVPWGTWFQPRQAGDTFRKGVELCYGTGRFSCDWHHC